MLGMSLIIWQQTGGRVVREGYWKNGAMAGPCGVWDIRMVEGKD